MAANAAQSSSLINSFNESDDNSNKFLSFCLGEEEYGLEILRVREIIGIIDITPLPQTPPYVKGVINLRGKIIPVIELRTKFGMESVPYTEETCVIVVEVLDEESSEEYQVGVIVDTVSEVLDITPDQIEPSPRFGGSLSTDYIMGMGKVKDKVFILLDTGRVLKHDELVNFSAPQINAAGTGEPSTADPQNTDNLETAGGPMEAKAAA
ncbi:MAG: chemotaxis protein CheW [Planctomycetota bacterium]|jgi:purine-binding chemotaxis protein CheW